MKNKKFIFKNIKQNIWEKANNNNDIIIIHDEDSNVLFEENKDIDINQNNDITE